MYVATFVCVQCILHISRLEWPGCGVLTILHEGMDAPYEVPGHRGYTPYLVGAAISRGTRVRASDESDVPDNVWVITLACLNIDYTCPL